MINEEMYATVITNCSNIAYELNEITPECLTSLSYLIEYNFNLTRLKIGTKDRFDTLNYIRDAAVDAHLHTVIEKGISSFYYEDFCIDDIIMPEKILFPLHIEDINIKTQHYHNIITALIQSHNKFSQEEANSLSFFRRSFKKYYSKLYSIAINLNHFTTRTKDFHEISDKYFDLHDLDQDWKEYLKPLNIKIFMPFGYNSFQNRKTIIKNVDSIIKFSRNNIIINNLIFVN